MAAMRERPALGEQFQHAALLRGGKSRPAGDFLDGPPATTAPAGRGIELADARAGRDRSAVAHFAFLAGAGAAELAGALCELFELWVGCTGSNRSASLARIGLAL